MRRMPTVLVVAFAVSVGVSACGDGGVLSTGAATTTTIAPEDAMLQFARCMREHGVEMPDPDSSGNFIARVGEDSMDPSSGTFRDAQRACKEFAPKLRNVSREDASEMQDKMRAMARCMRAKGFDMPDPVVVGADGSGDAAPPMAGRELDVDPEDPAFQKAQRECTKKVGLDGAAGGGIVAVRRGG